MSDIEAKTALRMAVRMYDDYQRMRLSMGNRIKIKKDGTAQVVPDQQAEGFLLSKRDQELFMGLYETAYQQEKVIEKHLNKMLKDFPIYTNWLKGIKGVGPVIAARIISNYDIHKAETVSKLWQYTGLNPGYVRGKKVVKKPEATKSGHEIIKEYKNKKGEQECIVLTDEMIRGDKLTPGFVAPFNKNMRTAMCGILADSFIKSQSYYALEFYYPYKARLEQEEGWKDEKPGHRDRAAKRYMIKMFLKDLYAAWREIEGLPVREPYQEEYLQHNSSRRREVRSKVERRPEV
jgi:hypothetical protein